MAELVVVTGGSYSGKTSVIDALAEIGHPVLPEAAYEVIRELTAAYGVDGQARWRIANPAEFQRLISDRQYAREQDARDSDAPFVFCDRGWLDGLAYSQLAGVPWPDEAGTRHRAVRYASVFMLDTLATFEMRLDTGRIHTHEESLRVAELLERVYAPTTARLIRIDEAPVGERVRGILAALGLGGG